MTILLTAWHHCSPPLLSDHNRAVPLMFLNGTAMSGGPDHAPISSAPCLGPVGTAARYRFWSVRDEFPGVVPAWPGSSEGIAIRGELYDMSDRMLAEVLLPAEPAELELGTVELDDGEVVKSMILRPERLSPGDRVVDISAIGSWTTDQRFVADNLLSPNLAALRSPGRA